MKGKGKVMVKSHDILHIQGDVICTRCGLKGEAVWTNSIPCSTEETKLHQEKPSIKGKKYKVHSKHWDTIKYVSEEDYFSLDKRIWKDYKEPYTGPIAEIEVDGAKKVIYNTKDLESIYIGA